jgi:23S rRNA pseudouridine1911/1915/1917 synthase
MPAPTPTEALPEDIPLDVIYEDEDIIVINKPVGMVVHPAAGNPSGTLVNALLYHCKESLSGIGGVVRPGIVHRIDKNTSGVLLVAKNDVAHVSLSEQIASKTCKRNYYALLEGVMKNNVGTVDTYLCRDPKCRTRYKVSSAEGKRAVTHYRVVKRYEKYTLCEFSLETGRTHQIRVHAKHLGHPVVGDPEYGYAKQKFDLAGQLLHAHQITFIHPTTGEEMTFHAPLPDYFEEILQKLR